MAGTKPGEYTHVRVQKKGDLHEEIRNLGTSVGKGQMRKWSDNFKERQKTWLFMTKLGTICNYVTRLDSHHVLPMSGPMVPPVPATL